jgi:hypothetical protein
MTLGDFFTVCSDHPGIVIFYLIAVPLTAVLALLLGRDEGHLPPWRYLYSTLVYLTCIPGIFAITLILYFFLFEKHSILDINIFTQVLPVVSMIVTLALIRRNVSLDLVPGFGKLRGLLMVMFAVFAILWILDRTRIFAITIVPMIWVLVIIATIILIAILGTRRMNSPS